MYSRVLCTAPRQSALSIVRPGLMVRRTASTTTVDPPKPAAETMHKSKMHGSYHWDLERALSIVSIPLLVTPFFIGSHPMVDLGLGVVIPLHSHIGFDAIIQDYLPVRRNPILGRVASYSLYAATGLCLYGCYQFNTNDVGITEFVKRLWTGKQ
ncbi:hypothetical protein PhCBS80983_g05508 [Powellomyces hirtus]|uniref:Succinate dehydrogenase [ubiquinone] cytochrome b small subunit n=1 Tax=Powellomyces hirtus TaxID=109895 RepID=A0A507DU01_9FUNG|nr:succinate dehydrogenase membrane anchor subunit [Powellomyces hirtus]TPX55229.1 hypothetical protein PhCBS80983_g05508 [Powellomyces hirtus]